MVDWRFVIGDQNEIFCVVVWLYGFVSQAHFPGAISRQLYLANVVFFKSMLKKERVRELRVHVR